MTTVDNQEPGTVDIVPGMAEAIGRRVEMLGLTPGEFAAASGLSEPGLAPVRKGVRRQYKAATRRGVAHALCWPIDWYARILAGEDPATFPHTRHDLGDEDRFTALEREVRDAKELSTRHAREIRELKALVVELARRPHDD